MEAVIPFSEKLWVYGPLGIISGIAIIVAIKLFILLTKERNRFDLALQELHKQHQEEMQALEERYITKAETWMAKYHEMAMSQDSTIKALRSLVEEMKRP